MKNSYKFKSVLKNGITFFSVILICSFSLKGQTQNLNRSQIEIDWEICKYYPAAEPQQTFVNVPIALQQKMALNNPCSTFIITYNGFTPEAQAAFQYAADIWANSLESSVPIRVNANFGPLAPNVLGGAGPDGYEINLPGFPSNVAFAAPLGEKILGEDSDGPTGVSNDINATFSSTANFYFGIDGNPPNDQIDFVSVVLHELGHGLGLLGFGRVDDVDEPTTGILRNVGFISSWDQFIENGSINPITAILDPSPALLSEFTSNNLFCNSPISTAQNGGVKPATYAPTIFRTGSSYSHLDENTYPAGNVNSLMTPFIAPGEAIHNPGSVTLGFMEDMGWSICGGSLTVKDVKAIEVSVAPNPFSDSITLKLANSESPTVTLSLFDINGRLILKRTQVIENGILKVSNLNALEASIYFLKITNEQTQASFTQRILKN